MKNLILISILALTACSTSKETKVTNTETNDTVKPGAPTKLEAQLGPSGAKLALHFSSAGENVQVTVSGIDGVIVTSPAEVLAGASVKAGQTKSFEVTFTGRGHLVVSVQGSFGARVHSVAIGEVQLQNDGSKILVTDDGDAVKLMP